MELLLNTDAAVSFLFATLARQFKIWNLSTVRFSPIPVRKKSENLNKAASFFLREKLPDQLGGHKVSEATIGEQTQLLQVFLRLLLAACVEKVPLVAVHGIERFDFRLFLYFHPSLHRLTWKSGRKKGRTKEEKEWEQKALQNLRSVTQRK